MAIEVRAVAVVDGTTVVDGPSGHRRQRRRQGQPILELLPAEPVEHQQDDLVGARHDGSGIHAGSRSMAAGREQGRHDVADAGAAVVGRSGCSASGFTSGRERATPTVPGTHRHRPWSPCASGPSPDAGRTMTAVRVSTRGDYASRALLSLALHADEVADVGPRHRRAHRPPPALPRADPARAEGRRPGAVQAGRRRRLRAGPRRPSDIRLVRHRERGRRSDHDRRLRRAPPERRVRPRGPVRAAGHLAAGRRPHARCTSRATPWPTWPRRRGASCRWPAARPEHAHDEPG